ncbi:hypothetical protein [Clostridium perfringens]|uniref:Uncharacterized protein n=1 Tax=Clostridium perfringens TaxID=1502 RepID=G5DSH6_CLOPF|nr:MULTISPECIES: hypothetical protein [Clostridium]AEP95017.1 hypothetical protein pNetB_00041 [Clostridium perfringens]MDM0719851.1 hypothetical protein [Clostridium perfringens]MDM0935680.1 hypothetical protein [Clostridium perfringens]UNM62044.1 hypothetical protein MN196_15750 [Clostridium perfringens]UYX11810.1 hypothetical protein OKA01_15760 [Clostridium perfringens]
MKDNLKEIFLNELKNNKHNQEEIIKLMPKKGLNLELKLTQKMKLKY